MLVYFCSTCGVTVPEQSIKSGTAVLSDGDKVHCYKCITNRSANVSDSKVYRALLAKRSEGGLKRQARSVSQRFLAQIPTGKFKRVVRRVSERMLGPQTGQFNAARGSGSRTRLPAATASTVASVTRKRTEANNLATASVACVVLAVGTLTLYLAFGSKKQPVIESNAPTPATPTTKPTAAPVETAQAPRSAFLPSAEPVRPVTRPRPAPTPAEVATTGTKEVAAPLPPLLSERSAPATATDFKDQLAQDRLKEAIAFHAANPKDAGYQKKLNDIVTTYRGTAVADEAARLLDAMVPPGPPKAAETLDWFANWQVDNLYKHAKAKMYEDFDGRKFVLETYPPEAEKELRLKWKMPVPVDKPIFEFSVRAHEQGDFDMTAEVDGKTSPIENIRGATWHGYALDLSAFKGQEVLVTLHHNPTGWENENAYWQAPRFSARADTASTLLVPGAVDSTPVAAAASSDWSKAVNLLSMVDPLNDSVAGTWAAQDGGMGVGHSLYARTEIPYAPPQEYDVKVVFTRVDGNDNITQILSHGGRSFAWTMGGANNTIFGFESIGGVSAVANPSTVRKKDCLENGRKYTSLVQVREGGLKAFLNGQLICSWKTDYSDMDIYQDWKLRDPMLLGLGSWNNQAVFHSAELLEVKGKGKAMRGELRAQPGAVFGDVKIEYERTLSELYATLATKGLKPALERAELAKSSAPLAPVRSKLELDAECFGYLLDVRRAALAGAEKLMDNRAFTFIKNDGKEIAVGTGSQSAIKTVVGEAINLEQSLGTAKAQVKLELDELSAQTQQDLARLGLPSAASASLKLTMVKLARLSAVSAGAHEALSKEITVGLDAAHKDASLAEKADHLQSHLALLDREFAAQQSFKAIDGLAKAGKWREAKNAIEEFKAEYLNSYSLEKVRPMLDQWAVKIEKETVSPLLKR